MAAERHRGEEENRLTRADWRELEIRGASVLLTTTPAVDGRRVAEYLGMESVEIVIGTGLFSELMGDIADFFGQRSKARSRRSSSRPRTWPSRRCG